MKLLSSPRKSPVKSLNKALKDLSGVAMRGSFGSTISVAEETSGRSSSLLTLPSPRTSLVQFNLAENRTVEPESPLSAQEQDAVWYSPEDATVFRRDCSRLARLLRAADEASTGSSSWSSAVRSAYQGFCQADTAEDVMKVFEDHQETALHDNALGLDSWVVRDIHYDRVERRRQMLQQMRRIQGSSSLHEAARIHKLHKVSRGLSRPSRLYAHHMGLLVAESVLEETSAASERR